MLLHWGEHTVNANEIADKLEKPMLDNPECPNFSRTRAFMEQVVAMLRQQQAEIEALKQIIDANNLSQNIGQFVNPDLKIEEVMSENCTCYKLGYSQLNDYAKVKQK